MDVDVGDDETAVRVRAWPLRIGGTALAVIIAAQLATVWELEPSGMQPFWPVAGIIVGIALLTPQRARVWVLLGGLAGQLLHSVVFASLGGSETVQGLVVTGIEVFGGAAVAAVTFGRRGPRGRTATVVLAFALAGLLLVVAAGAGSLWVESGQRATYIWQTAAGHFAGFVSVATLALVARGPKTWIELAGRRHRRVELVSTIGATIALVALAFQVSAHLYPLVTAALLWAALRFGLRAALPMAVLVAIYACIRTAAGSGPFAAQTTSDLVSLELFILTALVATILVGRHARSLDRAMRRNEALLSALPDLVTLTWGSNRDVVRISEGAGGEASTVSQAEAKIIAALRRVPFVDDAERPVQSQLERIDVDGHTRHVESRAIRVDRNHVLTVSRDVTDVVELLERLQTAERRLQRLADTGYEGFVEIDGNARVVYATDRFADLLGAEPHELLGEEISHLFDAADWHGVDRHAARLLGGDDVTFEANFRRRDGVRAWALVSAEPITGRNGTFNGAVIFAADTSAYHDEREARALAELQLAAVEHTERTRIARSLHDGPLQSLVALSYQLNAVANSADAPGRAAELEALALQAISALRGSLGELVPRQVTEGRVGPALQTVVEPFTRPGGPVLSVIDRTRTALPAEAATVLFQIGREALVNAVLHAGASHLDVVVGETDACYSIEVVDNGDGFTPARDGSAPERHLGLEAMRDRAHEAGGELVITSSASTGTRVRLELPRFAPNRTTPALDATAPTAAQGRATHV